MATTYTNKIIFQDGIYVNGETPLDDRLVLNSVSDLYITAGKKDCVLYQRAYKGMQITIFDNGEPKEFILKDITPYQKANAVTVNANNYNTYWELSGKVINERIDALETSLKKADSDLGTRITNEVKTLNDTIDSEVATLNSTITTNVNSLNSKIDTEVNTLEKSISSNVKTLNDTINTLDSKVDDEIEDRITAVNKINSSIGNTGSKTIATQLSELVSDLSALETKEGNDVKALNTSINSVSTTLTNSLTAETNARKAEDSSLSKAIDTINTTIGGTGSDSIATQIKNINSSISALATKEANDVNTLNTSINKLRSEFDVEIANLKKEDKELSSDIVGISDRLEDIEDKDLVTYDQLHEVELDMSEALNDMNGRMRILDSSLTVTVKDLAQAELVWLAAWDAMRKATHTDSSLPANPYEAYS